MDKKQMPISELPFNFDGLEPQYGQIEHAELICPGVYFIVTSSIQTGRVSRENTLW